MNLRLDDCASARSGDLMIETLVSELRKQGVPNSIGWRSRGLRCAA